MTTPKRPPPPARKAPANLNARGKSFWKLVMDRYELSRPEQELLAEAVRLLDELDRLEATVRKDGPTVAGSRGQVRAHPGLAEVRQHRLALGRILGQLSFPSEELPSPVQLRGRKAAEARWARHPRRGA